MKGSNSSKYLDGFSLLEILLAAALIGLVATWVYGTINPVDNFNSAQDSKRISDIANISDAISFYQIDNQTQPLANGDPLPLVTFSNVYDDGADFSDLDDFFPEYAAEAELDPDGNEYKIGVLNTGSVIVATQLNSGDVVTETTQGEVPPPPPDLTLGQVIKVNAQNGLPLGTLAASDTIDIGVTPNFSIRVQPTNNSDVDRIEFYVDGALEINETQIPYSIAGDAGGSIIPWGVGVGTYAIDIIAYDNANNPGPTYSYSLEVIDTGGGSGPPVDPFSVESILLADADADTVLGFLQEGQVIDLSVTPSISLIAVPASSPDIDRVEFYVNGVLERSEGVEPYTIAGDGGVGGFGDYFPWIVGAGSYTLEAVPIDNSAVSYPGLVINFTIVN